jgi:hypothetical protein
LKPTEALKLLGASRVIWIDDHFATGTAEHLAELLGVNLETARKCGLDEYEDLFVRIDNDDQEARVELVERLGDLSSAQRLAIKRKFFAVEANSDSGSDLTQDQIKCICEQLDIVAGDCWPFEDAESRMAELCEKGDPHISYIIDLHDAYGAVGNKRGLDLLKVLHAGKSKATALLLTHEATTTNEAERERELRELLGDDVEPRESPVCVIAKERLEGDPIDTVVSEGLRVAIKRAGLRRSVHEVLLRAKSEVTKAFEAAMASLLHVPPEQLDVYVVGRAYSEGVSELHVVERALTASMSESFRMLFATDADTLQSAQRLRALRDVPLSLQAAEPDKNLETFRRKELWESNRLVNASFSPLACGDVFEFDPDEGVADQARMFILLAQPCDVMIRPSGDRDTEAGILVPLKLAQEANAGGDEKLKQPPLPFPLDGKQWVCDFRRATSARLSILDLATLRADGKVKYEAETVLPSSVLPGQAKSGKQLLGRLAEAMKQRRTQRANVNKATFDVRCQLTLSAAGPFKDIANATYVPAAAATDDKPVQAERFTWKIRRAGRVRMPYAASLLSNYLAVQGREAFDLDYLKPLAAFCSPSCAVDVKEALAETAAVATPAASSLREIEPGDAVAAPTHVGSEHAPRGGGSSA